MKTLIKAWARCEHLLLIAILMVMITLAVTQIILRNLFETSFFWIDPFNRLLVLWLAILGAMVATREHEHIAIDVLKHVAGKAIVPGLVRLTSLISALVCLLMTWHSVRFVYEEYLYETTTFSSLPAWPFELIMPVGFMIMTMRFAVSVIRPYHKEI